VLTYDLSEFSFLKLGSYVTHVCGGKYNIYTVILNTLNIINKEGKCKRYFKVAIIDAGLYFADNPVSILRKRNVLAWNRLSDACV
jgi:hypothetical protein